MARFIAVEAEKLPVMEQVVELTANLLNKIKPHNQQICEVTEDDLKEFEQLTALLLELGYKIKS